MKRSLFLLISLIVLTSLILSGCGPKVDTVAKANGIPDASYIPFPSNGKSVTGAWSQEPDNIVPFYTQMSYAIWITQLTLAGLGEWDEGGNFVAELAAEVPSGSNGGVSADGLTITWKLQSGLKWSDGEPLTSADVKFTWESIMDPGNAVMSRVGYDKIASIDTPDDTTVVLNFSELYPPWQTLFTQGPNNSGALLPKHILEGQTALEGNPFIHWPKISSGSRVSSGRRFRLRSPPCVPARSSRNSCGSQVLPSSASIIRICCASPSRTTLRPRRSQRPSRC